MCRRYSSLNEVEFPSEIMIHFTGRKRLDNPGVLTFPSMLVCLDCGSTQLTISEADLALLRAGSAPSAGAPYRTAHIGKAA